MYWLTGDGGGGKQNGWLSDPRCPRVAVVLLVGRDRAQEFPGLVPACWFVSWILTQKAVGLWWSWGWCSPTAHWWGGVGAQGFLQLVLVPLVGKALTWDWCRPILGQGSCWDLWLWGPGGRRIGVWPAHGWGLGLRCPRAGGCPLVGNAGPAASVGSLVQRAASQGLWL